MVTRFLSIYSILGRGEGGQSIVVVALLFTALCAFTALGLDGAMWYYQKTRMQTAADAAAVAGTYELSRNWNGTAISTTVANVQAQANTLAQANGFPTGENVSLTFLDSNGQPLATQPTTTIASNTRGVKVSAQQNYSTSFAGVFGFSSLPVTTVGAGTFGSVSGMGIFPMIVGGGTDPAIGSTWSFNPYNYGSGCGATCVNYGMLQSITGTYPSTALPSVSVNVGTTVTSVAYTQSNLNGYIQSLINADPGNSCSNPTIPSPRIVFIGFSNYGSWSGPGDVLPVTSLRALMFTNVITSGPSSGLLTGCWVRANAPTGAKSATAPYNGVTTYSLVPPP